MPVFESDAGDVFQLERGDDEFAWDLIPNRHQMDVASYHRRSLLTNLFVLFENQVLVDTSRGIDTTLLDLDEWIPGPAYAQGIAPFQGFANDESDGMEPFMTDSSVLIESASESDMRICDDVPGSDVALVDVDDF
jgi:hypothetical protein